MPPALILLPGMDGTGTLFAPFVDALGEHAVARVIAYPRDRSMGYEELASFVRDKLPNDREFVVLGESFSGPVATLLAAEKPHGLRALILCATFVRNPRPSARPFSRLVDVLPVSRLLARLASPAFVGWSVPGALRDAFVMAVGDMGEATLRSRLHAVLTVDVSEALRRLDVPLLYLRGTHDVVVPASAGEWIRRVKPGTTIDDIPGPHGLLQAAPVACAAAVTRFLASLPVSRCHEAGVPLTP